MSSAGAVDPLLLRAWQEVSEGIVVLDAHDWRVVHVNPSGAALHGAVPGDLVGRLLSDVFPAAVGSDFHDQLRRTRTEPGLVTWTGPVPGTDRWIAVRAQRVDDHVLCSFRDVTAEHAVEVERDALTRSLSRSLEHTSRLLRMSEALTATRTVADVARVVVETAHEGFGAAYSALSVVDHERGLLRTPFTGELAAGAEQEWQDLPLDGPGPGTLALRQGSPRFDDAAGLRTGFPELMHRWEVADVRYLATVPLVAAGVPVGLLTVVWHEDLELSENQRAMLVALASYTTQALQRALLLRERTATARTLQSSMLTTDLPQPDHLELTARYVTAHAEDQVGGDWYDALVLPDGTTLLVIGDVSGHDVTAAAEMGQLRIALRALAVDRDDPPAELLRRLESVVDSLRGDTILASCLVARVEQSPADRARGVRTLRWANAGHPPPVLVAADGGARVLGAAPDLLVGVGVTERSDHVVEVPAGSTLLLYTDGLVERRDDDLDAGTERLRVAARALAGPDPGAGLDALLAELGDAGGDDVALLAVRFHAQD
ncbi:serine phosphatase RsbU (regulator of sigma subunit) [Kineococcus radiotolerans]|uniref:Serine phosphatase RsbU (Regulator of sigma subunit) n=1 Tax=Kineococcus radiotolerans TaxID=131568 RepID=A0A7W4TL76_KINRA|nr:SpoIIE family protein phosphatase [Kineococcus radiotolerans]MBB2900965.1 serine phosphatase RsbU (regulator of sigma subunit) [Kineococcus radiotolerans]